MNKYFLPFLAIASMLISCADNSCEDNYDKLYEKNEQLKFDIASLHEELAVDSAATALKIQALHAQVAEADTFITVVLTAFNTTKEGFTNWEANALLGQHMRNVENSYAEWGPIVYRAKLAMDREREVLKLQEISALGSVRDAFYGN